MPIPGHKFWRRVIPSRATLWRYRWRGVVLLLLACLAVWALDLWPQLGQPAPARWLYTVQTPDGEAVVDGEGRMVLAPQPGTLYTRFVSVPLTDYISENVAHLRGRSMPRPDDYSWKAPTTWIWRLREPNTSRWRIIRRWPILGREDRRQFELYDSAGRLWANGTPGPVIRLSGRLAVIDREFSMLEADGWRSLGMRFNDDMWENLEGLVFENGYYDHSTPNGYVILGNRIYGDGDDGKILAQRPLPEWLWGDCFAYCATVPESLETMWPHHLLDKPRGVFRLSDGAELVTPDHRVTWLGGSLLLLTNEAKQSRIMDLATGRELALADSATYFAQNLICQDYSTRIVLGRRTLVLIQAESGLQVYDHQLNLLRELPPAALHTAAIWLWERAGYPYSRTTDDGAMTVKQTLCKSGQDVRLDAEESGLIVQLGPGSLNRRMRLDFNGGIRQVGFEAKTAGDGTDRWRQPRVTPDLPDPSRVTRILQTAPTGRAAHEREYAVWLDDGQMGVMDDDGRWLQPPRAAVSPEHIADVRSCDEADGSRSIVSFYRRDRDLWIDDGPVLTLQGPPPGVQADAAEWAAYLDEHLPITTIQDIRGRFVVVGSKWGKNYGILYYLYDRQTKQWWPEHIAGYYFPSTDPLVLNLRGPKHTAALLDADGHAFYRYTPPAPEPTP